MGMKCQRLHFSTIWNTRAYDQFLTTGVSKVRPAGRIRPAKVSNPARSALPENSNMGRRIYLFSRFIHASQLFQFSNAARVKFQFHVGLHVNRHRCSAHRCKKKRCPQELEKTLKNAFYEKNKNVKNVQ